MTTKIVTVRIPSAIYSDLCEAEATLGVSVSAHVRRVIERESDAQQIDNLRTELLGKLAGMSIANAAAPSEITEILLLSRAIAAHCNPQIVAQVRAKLAQANYQ